MYDILLSLFRYMYIWKLHPTEYKRNLITSGNILLNTSYALYDTTLQIMFKVQSSDNFNISKYINNLDFSSH